MCLAHRGFGNASIRPKPWSSTIQKEGLGAELSDFLAIVRNDMFDDVANLLTLVIRGNQDGSRTPISLISHQKEAHLSHSLKPIAMGNPPFPLHLAAKWYYGGVDDLP